MSWVGFEAAIETWRRRKNPAAKIAQLLGVSMTCELGFVTFAKLTTVCACLGQLRNNKQEVSASEFQI